MSLWSRLTGGARAGAETGRWVAVDVETTGLDPRHDALVSIGAVALVEGRIALHDSFEVNVRQDAIRAGPDILVHGVGVGAQRAGVALAEALDAFSDFVASAPRVGFHAPFDAAVLARATAQTGRPPIRGAWLDVAELAPVLRPELASRCRTLDEWLSANGIRCDNRHNGAADALATAQLLIALLPAARRQGIAGYAALCRAARAGRWLGQPRG